MTQHDAHLIPWFKAKFGLTIERQYDGYFHVWFGDYDLDIKTACGRTVWSAAVEYVSCYGPEAHWDRLNDLEMGRAA